jgi:HAMP domain-containing protein
VQAHVFPGAPIRYFVAVFWNTHAKLNPSRSGPAEDPAELHRLVVRHYGDAMDAVGKHFPDAPRDLFEELKREARTVRSSLEPHLHPGILDDLGKRFTVVVEEFGKRVNGYLRRQDSETREILKLVSAMTETLGKHDKDYSLRFQGITKKLKSLSTSSDLAEIKWQLAAEVEQLEKSVADMTRDTAGSILRLQESIAQFQPRKTEAPPAAVGPAGPVASAAAAVEPLKARRRFCVGLYLIEPVTESALSFLYSRCAPGDALEKTRQGEYIIVKDCTLLDMADEVGKVRKELERMGITTKAGAAEMMKGEQKEVVVGRARASAGALLNTR